MTREEIIKGLECCSSVTGCGADCPYWEDMGECRTRLEEDALKLLKARVLAVEELPGWDGAVLIEVRPSSRLTWALYLDEYYPALRFQDVGCVIVLPTSEYGVGWRCWDRRPTDAERRAEEWRERD